MTAIALIHEGKYALIIAVQHGILQGVHFTPIPTIQGECIDPLQPVLDLIALANGIPHPDFLIGAPV